MSDKAAGAGTKQGLSRAFITRAIILLALCCVVTFTLVTLKLFEVQITQHDRYESQALGNQLRRSSLTASRGAIYDTNGKILAMSAAVENVFISPYEIDHYDMDVKLVAEGLSGILGVPSADIIEKSAKLNSQYQVVKSKVESAAASEVKAFIKDNRLKGIYLEPATKRYYPNGSLACQIIGFTGTDNKGLEGLEQRYNAHLTGVNGREVRLKNARGTDMLLDGYDDYFSAQNGDSIVLTIDSQIQYYVEKHVEKAIEDYGVQNGACCLVMNAKTGEILADANYPNYDLNDFLTPGSKDMEKLADIEDEEEYRNAFNEALYKQWRNRSFADTYEPGSVFKIITLAMALEENVASEESYFDCRGSMEIPGRTNPKICWMEYGHGVQSLRQSIQNSCNIAVVNLALRVGAERFYDYIHAFGLFNKTGIDSNSESSSIWWSENVFFEKTNQSQLAAASFGQTFKVTPIQMVTAVAAAVNGGYLMQPYIVKQILDSDGAIVHTAEPTVVRQVVSAGTSRVVRDILEDVVNAGTGKNAQVRGYRVGGKTGTSENIEKQEEDEAKKDYIVSFIGFAPADDPEIVILLLMDSPSHDTGIYISGGSMAAPVVGNILADILPLYLGIKPDYTPEELKEINVDMPRVTGKGTQDAVAMLEDQGYECVVVGDGAVVTGQLPAPNAHIAYGTTVRLYAGEDVPKDTSTVPQLSGMSYAAAKENLESRGMFIRTTGAPRSDKKAEVSVQSIPSGTNIVYGAVVEVTLIDKSAVELH